MFALTMILLVISLICAPIGLMKFPWGVRTFREMSPAQRSRFWESTAIIMIPLTLTALSTFGMIASIS